MSGNGRRRNSKWDLEEDILPENHHDNAHSNKIRSSFHEHDSRDHMSGTRDLQRAENMNEEIPVFEGDGHFSTRKSTAPDEGRQQSRAYSSKNRGRSYRSRSRSKSRSRSPARNPRRQSSFNDQSNKSGHSAPLCRDFAAGRCRKGDHCLFAHTNLGRHLDRRVGGDRERDEKSLRSHHDSSGRRSTNICTDFVKGRCRRGASCKYSHHDSGSDEFRKWTVDGSHRDGYNYTHNENVYAENKSPNDRQPKHNMNGNHEVRGDAKWSDTTSLRSMPKSPGWDDHIVQQASADIRYGPAFMQTDAPSDYKQQSVSTFVDGATGTTNNESFSVNDLWKSQPAFPLNPMNEGMQMPYYQAAVDTKPAEGQSQRTFPSHQPVINSKPDMSNALVSQAASGPTTSQSSFFSEQLLQIPHLSTTLSQLYAAIPQGVMMDGGSNLPNSSASVLPPVSGASVLTNPITKPTQQYDPMCDGIETKMARTMNEFVSSSVTPSLPAVPTSLVTGETTTSDYLIGLSGDDLGHQNLDSNQQSGAVGKEEQNGGETGKETNEGEEEEVGEDMAVNDEKKAKDVKEIRPFKFALAEYVKELLKPTWKEGKLNKEVYKTIVKKVVEKVTESIQEAHIPRTKEKIDQYLSFSKPKLTKLVQAYVERYKKN